MRRQRRCGRKEIGSDVFLGDMVVGETGISHGDRRCRPCPEDDASWSGSRLISRLRREN